MEGDEVIRLAKQLAFFLKALAKEVDVELDETTITASADEKEIVKLNAGVLVRQAQSLVYGSLEPDE